MLDESGLVNAKANALKWLLLLAKDWKSEQPLLSDNQVACLCSAIKYAYMAKRAEDAGNREDYISCSI